MNDEPAPLEVASLSKRRRGALVRALMACALSIVIAASCLAYYIVSNSRNKVIGPVDPVSGYRIEYTVSTRYPIVSVSPANDTTDFIPGPAPRVVRWIRTHILRRKDSDNVKVMFQQYNWTNQPDSMLKTDAQGYPELRNEMNLSKHEHFRVCGYPATWISTGDGVKVLSGDPLNITGFAVHPPGTSLCYAFAGFCESEHERAEVNRELRAIRDSIRIVKSK